MTECNIAYTLRLLAVWLLVLLGSGCAQIPTNDLTQYREAFNQSKEVSEQILLDFDQALKVAETFQLKASPAATVPEPYPTEWGKVGRARSDGARDDIETRRKAWTVVAKYNDVIALLAEGKSVEKAKASATGLVSSVSKLNEVVSGSAIPGLNAISGLVSIFFEQIERARLHDEFVRALRSGAPVVDGILKAFIADIASHYEARAVIASRERIRHMAKMRTIQRSVVRIVGAYNVADNDVASFRLRVEKAFSVQKSEPAANLSPINSGGAAAAAFSEVAKSQVGDELAELEAVSKSYVENIRQVEALIAMLDQYKSLLQKTSTALATLLSAIDKPQDMAVATDDLLAIAFSVRRNLEELKAARQ